MSRIRQATVLRRPPPARVEPASMFWAAVACCSALAIGAVATIDLQAAAAVAIAVALAFAVAYKPAIVLSVLILSVLVEVVSLGGITISRIVAPIALLTILAEASRGRARFPSAPPFAWAVVYAIWALASALWTVSLPGTGYLLGSLVIAVVYMLAFATLLASQRDLERALYALAFGALGVGAFAVFAFFSGSENRASGGIGDPNFFAAFQVVALPLVLVLAAETRRPWVRLALFLTALIIVGSVFTSLSRGGLLTLAGLVALTLVLPARTIFRSRREKIVVLVILLVGAGIAFQSASQALVPRLESIFAPSDAGSGRLNEWLAAWTAIQERPGLGLGYGSFADSSNELMRRTPGVDLVNFGLRPEGSEAHNAYISTLAELGGVGLFLFLGLLVATALALRRTAKAARTSGAPFVARVSNALLISLASWCIAALFLSAEASRSLWIIIGLSLALPKLARVDLIDRDSE